MSMEFVLFNRDSVETLTKFSCVANGGNTKIYYHCFILGPSNAFLCPSFILEDFESAIFLRAEPALSYLKHK